MMMKIEIREKTGNVRIVEIISKDYFNYSGLFEAAIPILKEVEANTELKPEERKKPFETLRDVKFYSNGFGICLELHLHSRKKQEEADEESLGTQTDIIVLVKRIQKAIRENPTMDPEQVADWLDEIIHIIEVMDKEKP